MLAFGKEYYTALSAVNLSQLVSVGLTEFLKVFKVLRLNEDVVSKEFSGKSPSASSRALEVAPRAFRAPEEWWLAQPHSTQVVCTRRSRKLEIIKLKGTRGSLKIAGAVANEVWCEDASVWDRHENPVLDADNQSSYSLPYRREVSMEEVASTSEDNDPVFANLSSSRIAGGNRCSSDDVTCSRDDNYYQNSPTVVSYFSKDGFCPAVEIKEILKKVQATQNRVALNQWRKDKACRPDLKNYVDNRYLNRSIHHLLAVLSLPRTSAIHRRPVTYEADQIVFSKGEIAMGLDAIEENEYSTVVSRTNESDGIYCRKRILDLWNGYWVGPDYEDGWGFVEALVSPVDMGEPVCSI